MLHRVKRKWSRYEHVLASYKRAVICLATQRDQRNLPLLVNQQRDGVNDHAPPHTTTITTSVNYYRFLACLRPWRDPAQFDLVPVAGPTRL